MRKKHLLKDRIKFIKMLEAGSSVRAIHIKYGIDVDTLSALWQKYQLEGPSAIVKRKKSIRVDGAYREQVLRYIEKNHVTLSEAAVKYDVSVARIRQWRRQVREGGYEALYLYHKAGRPSKDMGRPKKKKPEEMTELERLRYENECLRTENALLKKVRALVEERNARLREIGQKPSKN